MHIVHKQKNGTTYVNKKYNKYGLTFKRSFGYIRKMQSKWYCNSFHCLPTILNLIKISYMFWKIKYRDGQTFLRITCSLLFVPSLKHMKIHNI
jgi:hypothetical protein